jgi:hypothetical protein
MAIYRQPTPKPCPVQLLCNYLTRRGNSPGPILITQACGGNGAEKHVYFLPQSKLKILQPQSYGL